MVFTFYPWPSPPSGRSGTKTALNAFSWSWRCGLKKILWKISICIFLCVCKKNRYQIVYSAQKSNPGENPVTYKHFFFHTHKHFFFTIELWCCWRYFMTVSVLFYRIPYVCFDSFVRLSWENRKNSIPKLRRKRHRTWRWLYVRVRLLVYSFFFHIVFLFI